MKTLIVAIVDESGSMATKLNDVIGGWNTFLETQKAVKDDEATLILAKFNTRVTVAHEATPIADVQPFDTKTYTPGGGTALYDAIAEAIRLADKQTFDRAVALIITDGEENSSRETTMEQVKQIIQGYTARGNWTFTYLGEQPEKWARETGTQVGNVGQYNQQAPGQSFSQAAQATSHLRASGMAASASFYDPNTGGGQTATPDPAFKTGNPDPAWRQGPFDEGSDNTAKAAWPHPVDPDDKA